MRGSRVVPLVAVLCVVVPAAHDVQGRGDPPQTAGVLPQAPSAKVADASPPPRAMLDKYCVTCHNQRLKTGGLALDALDLARVSEHAEQWEKVVRKIRTGAMPPVGRPRPDKALSASAASWLEAELDRAAFEHPNPGRPTLHRLNRVEYRNAIRDLLALEIDPTSLLPADNAGHGFDNNADALSLSPALTERYLDAAAKISQMALAHVRDSQAQETVFVPTDRNQGSRFSEDLPWGSRGGLAIRYYFPVDGAYLFQLRLNEGGAGGGIIGLTAEPHQLDVSIDHAKVWTATVGGPEFANVRGDERTEKVLEALQFHVLVKAGSHLVQVYFVQKTSASLEDLFDPYLRRDPYRAGNGEPGISSVTITGPPSPSFGALRQGSGRPERQSKAATSPPRTNASDAATADSPSRRRLFVCRPVAVAEEARCARNIIAALARRAYRRPVTDEDLQIPLARYRDGASEAGVTNAGPTRGSCAWDPNAAAALGWNGGFEYGLELALRSILVSPKFLFRFESQPETVAANTAYRITDLELASRLSFFLWSSIPDDELLNVAEKKTLHNPAVLGQQVKRMLADPRSEALVSNFAGQWLHIRNVSGLRPSPELYFHFDDNLRQAFARETELFFDSIIRENRSVLDLLDADYTFLNERLARHYGIAGVYGERFRRVSLPADSVRRGLLGQGSILTGTSRANRTSPVIRGKWILENIFGTPPPPPLPNVPELKEERNPAKVLPMREQMAQHRADPVCASCHAQMDELGFALENFDAIGEWRDVDAAGSPIDASATLSDGTTFRGPVELRKVLRDHSDDFLTTVTEKLLTYALGRGLEVTDAPAVRHIKREAARSNYRLDSLIQGIVSSTPFQMRMAQARAN
jgi:mono/diheme cytochrome c family protein